MIRRLDDPPPPGYAFGLLLCVTAVASFIGAVLLGVYVLDLYLMQETP